MPREQLKAVGVKMGFTVHEAVDGKAEVLLDNEPSFCWALSQSPIEMEFHLKQGLWLVMEISPSSIDDRVSIAHALCAIKGFGGQVNLGIRPFNALGAIKKWCPASQIEYVSPVWLVLKDGVLVEERARLLNKKQITQMLKAHLGEK